MTRFYSTIFKGLTGLMMLVLIPNVGFSQIAGKDIYKKYVQADSTIHKASVLILFKDSTFINYGTLNDSYSKEYYVWYDSGNWSLKDSEIKCNTNSKIFDQNKLIGEIKFFHKWRTDYGLYNRYYEFVKENYKNYSFILIKNKVIDLNKKIEYCDVQSNESMSNNK